MTEKKDDRNIRQRLFDAMKAMENPTKSKTATVPTKSGKSYTYHYESLDQVLECVRPHLTENGLGLAQSQQWKGSERGYVLVTAIFDSNEELLLDERPMLQFTDAQSAGSWETYMRRYALRSAFGLAGEDDDGAATKGATQAPKRQPRPKKATPSQIAAINDAASAVSVMKDKPISDVLAALGASQSVKAAGVPDGTAIEAYTESQAAVALGVIRTWAEKAEHEAPTAELADNDIPF